MQQGDTITALSTPPGRGGIGVVRLSGPDSLLIAATVFHGAADVPLGQPARAQFGHIIDGATDNVIDEAILVYFKAPHSYTGEDVVELSCHGSPVILARLLALLTAQGARVAEPGEFTFRAFFNRRIDIAQAQAVRDVINAQTEYQARVATRQLEGALSKRLTPLKNTLVEIIVNLESSVEFVEEDISPETITALLLKLDRVIEGLTDIAASFAFGRYVKEGFQLAIIGRPNVGKSSIFNRLVGSDRAIVTELPGTTRDALYESTSISGVPVRLIDTAGIRETSDVIESLGITRSRSAIDEADISFLVFDQSEPLTEDDARLLELVPRSKRIILLNKIDLPCAIRLDLPRDEGESEEEAIALSALTGSGFDRLTEAIFLRLSGEASTERDDIMITDARQHSSVQSAVELLKDARVLMIQSEFEEVVLLRLHAALFALGEVTGETLTEDILGQIFSTFCIGK